MAPGNFKSNSKFFPFFKHRQSLDRLLSNDYYLYIIYFVVGYIYDESKLEKNAEYASDGIISPKCDVYSYGVLLMETFTRKKPTDEMFTGEMSLKHWIKESLPHGLTEVVDANLVREVQASYAKMDCLLRIMHLALGCCMDSPEQRMWMTDVVVKLQKIKQTFLVSG